MFLTNKKILSILAVLVTAAMLFLCACGKTAVVTEEAAQAEATVSAAETGDTAATTEASTAKTSSSDLFTDRDYEVGYDESTAVIITLTGDTAQASGAGVTVEGGTVTLTQEATYVLTGTLNGTVVIDMDSAAKPHIILKNASVTSDDSAALNVVQADKVFVTLAEGTENTLANGGSFAESETGVDGAVFSKDDITFNGAGSLTVTSPAGHGIVGKDDVVFTGGAYTVSAASHGIDANDSVRIDNATLTVDAGKDGVHCENNDDETKGFVYIAGGTLTIEAEGDGVSAGTDLTVEDGDINVIAGGGSVNAAQKTSDNWGQYKGGMGSRGMGGGRPDMGDTPEMPGSDGGTVGLAYETEQTLTAESLATGDADSDSTSIKGLKADGSIAVNGGTITVDAADDAIHSNASVTVSDGTLTLTSGDDGIHADDTLTVSGGSISVTDSYEGLEGQTINVTGGQIAVNASDDGLNAAGGTDESGFGGMRGGDMFGGRGGIGGGSGDIMISGGQVSVKAGGDGIDSNGTVTISGGSILVDCPTMGDTSPFDYDGTAAITGGTLIATGSSNMAEGFTSAAQGVIAGRLSEQSGGTSLSVTDGSGSEILSTTPENSYNYILISSPELTSGGTYNLTVGGNSQSVTAR